MTPKLKGTSPLFKKCALGTITFHLNPFRATFLFKKAPTKTQKKTLIAVASVNALKSPYLHIAACHLGDLALTWGSLPRWGCQAMESLHQWVKKFGRGYSSRKQWVQTTAKNIVVKSHHAGMQARRGQKMKRLGGSMGHTSGKELQHHLAVKKEIVKDHLKAREAEAKITAKITAKKAKKAEQKRAAKANC